jgi:hypothetical protein
VFSKINMTQTIRALGGKCDEGLVRMHPALQAIKPASEPIPLLIQMAKRDRAPELGACGRSGFPALLIPRSFGFPPVEYPPILSRQLHLAQGFDPRKVSAELGRTES